MALFIVISIEMFVVAGKLDVVGVGGPPVRGAEDGTADGVGGPLVGGTEDGTAEGVGGSLVGGTEDGTVEGGGSNFVPNNKYSILL